MLETPDIPEGIATEKKREWCRRAFWCPIQGWRSSFVEREVIAGEVAWFDRAPEEDPEEPFLSLGVLYRVLQALGRAEAAEPEDVVDGSRTLLLQFRGPAVPEAAEDVDLRARLHTARRRFLTSWPHNAAVILGRDKRLLLPDELVFVVVLCST